MTRSIIDRLDQFRQQALAFYLRPAIDAGLNREQTARHVETVRRGLAAPLAFNTSLEPAIRPACRFWDQLSAEPAPDLAALVRAARDGFSHFHWKINANYQGVFSDHFFENESFTEIIGPNGLLLADDFRLGFLILGEKVHYPWHSHAATELYHIVSGTGIWEQGDRIPRQPPPGTAIYHDSWETHAMTTTDPMLAFWTWTGSIADEAVPD